MLDDKKNTSTNCGKKSNDGSISIPTSSSKEQHTSSDEENWILAWNYANLQNLQDGFLMPLNNGNNVKNMDSTIHPQSSLRDFGNPNSNTYFNADIQGSGIADVVALCQFEFQN